MATKSPVEQPLLYVEIELNVKGYERPVALCCGFHPHEHGKKDILQQAKAELVDALVEHRRTGFCDFSVVLFDDRFLDAVKQVLEYNITKDHLSAE